MTLSSILQGSSNRIGSGSISANFSNTFTGTYTSGGFSYKYVTFTGSGTLVITSSGLVDVLVVSGGGAGRINDYDYAGGGSGGLYYKENLFLNAGSYVVVVGGGGSAATNPGGSGNTSEIINTIAKIGGGEGGFAGNYWRAGNNRFGGGGSPGAFAGSDISNVNGNGAGAGGTVFGSNARDGRSISITGSPVTYATGGLSTGGSGSANTGNGGGGDFSGGSGIVIIRTKI